MQHWYIAKARPGNIDEFKKVTENSYADDATFMNALRITRFTKSGSLALKNLELTETTSSGSRPVTIKRNEIFAVVREKFGMPANLVMEVLESLKELKDIYD